MTPQRPLLKENEDYIFTEIILADEVVQAVKLLRGSFVQVTYYYGHVKVVPQGDTHVLAYQYTIWDSAGHTKAELTKSSEFTTLIGDVLVSIITDEKNLGEYGSIRRGEEADGNL